MQKSWNSRIQTESVCNSCPVVKISSLPPNSPPACQLLGRGPLPCFSLLSCIVSCCQQLVCFSREFHGGQSCLLVRVFTPSTQKHGCDVCPQNTDTVTTNISCMHALRLSQTQAYTVSPNEREGGMDEKEMRTEIIISSIWHVATKLQVFVNCFWFGYVRLSRC